MSYNAYPIHFYDPNLPLTSFLALDSRLVSRSNSRPQTAFDRQETYGTSWIKPENRCYTNTPSQYLSKQHKASTRRIRTAEKVKKQADYDRVNTIYLKNSKSPESQAWLAEKEKSLKKKNKVKKVDKEVKKKSEDFLKREKLQKKVDSKIMFQLWCDWKKDKQAQRDRVSFADYKEIRSNIEQEKLVEKEFPVYKSEGHLRSTGSNDKNTVSINTINENHLNNSSSISKSRSLSRPQSSKPLITKTSPNRDTQNFIFNETKSSFLSDKGRNFSEKNFMTGKVAV